MFLYQLLNATLTPPCCLATSTLSTFEMFYKKSAVCSLVIVIIIISTVCSWRAIMEVVTSLSQASVGGP